MNEKPKYEIMQDNANMSVVVRVIGNDRRAWGKYINKSQAREAIREAKRSDRYFATRNAIRTAA